MSFNSLELGRYICQHIKNAIGSSVSDRVYAITAKQDSVLPLVIYTLSGNEITYGGTGDSAWIALQIQLFDYRQSGIENLRTLNDTLFDYLHRKIIDDSSFDNYRYVNTTYGVEFLTDDIFEIRSSWKIFIVAFNFFIKEIIYGEHRF
jgi:hypothetical protein